MYRLVHHLSAMEPPCSLTYHILYVVYLLEQLTNTGFLNNRIPPLVVTENHNGMCSNSSLKSFPNQAASYEIILIDMYLVSVVLMATDFCFLLIHYIKAESKEKQY